MQIISQWIIGKNRIGEKYNTNKKIDVAVPTVIDLNMKKIQQNTEATLENLEQKHNKEYINFERDEICSSKEDEDDY